jgi:hypothetical protein
MKDFITFFQGEHSFALPTKAVRFIDVKRGKDPKVVLVIEKPIDGFHLLELELGFVKDGCYFPGWEAPRIIDWTIDTILNSSGPIPVASIRQLNEQLKKSVN